MLTQSELKSLLHYDPDSGNFAWLISFNRKIRVGDVAGCASDGYIQIKIKDVRYQAHRLAWVYVYGDIPDGAEIDHVNMTRDDNRIINLRLCTGSENMKNTKKHSDNTSGYKNVYVYYLKDGTPRYRARCTDKDGKSHNIGTYRTAELASATYEAFAKLHHGEFYRN